MLYSSTAVRVPVVCAAAAEAGLEVAISVCERASDITGGISIHLAKKIAKTAGMCTLDLVRITKQAPMLHSEGRRVTCLVSALKVCSNVRELLTRFGVVGVLVDIPDAPFASVFPANGLCTVPSNQVKNTSYMAATV